MNHTENNLARLKAIYAAWHDRKGDCLDLFRDIMADQIVLRSMDENQPGLAFATDCCTRDQALGYLGGIFRDWDMEYYTPDHYLADGDRIAVFGRCGYRNKATGKLADCRIATMWRFEGDKAVEFIDIFDSARAVAAATP